MSDIFHLCVSIMGKNTKTCCYQYEIIFWHFYIFSLKTAYVHADMNKHLHYE